MYEKWQNFLKSTLKILSSKKTPLPNFCKGYVHQNIFSQHKSKPLWFLSFFCGPWQDIALFESGEIYSLSLIVLSKTEGVSIVYMQMGRSKWIGPNFYPWSFEWYCPPLSEIAWYSVELTLFVVTWLSLKLAGIAWDCMMLCETDIASSTWIGYLDVTFLPKRIQCTRWHRWAYRPKWPGKNCRLDSRHRSLDGANEWLQASPLALCLRI